MFSSTYRILDANLNRAREGLRVIEDWCRFVIESQKLSADVKTIRHQIFQIAQVAGWTKDNLLPHRDTVEDVGIHNSTALQYKRGHEKDILSANF